MGKLSELLFCSLGNFGLQTSLAQMTVVGILVVTDRSSVLPFCLNRTEQVN